MTKSNQGIFLFSLLVLLIFSCAKKSTNPGEENPPNTHETVIIGTDGGVVATDDAAIQVPSGTFTGEQNLSLSSQNPSPEFGDLAISKLYKLTGLPETINKPLRVALKTNAEIGENVFIAVGELALDEATGDTMVFYDLFSATDSSGFIVADVEILSQSTLAKSSGAVGSFTDLGILFQAVTDYELWSGLHYLVEFPRYMSTDKVNQMVLRLEDAYNFVYDSLGFNFHTVPTIRVMIKVIDNPVETTFDLSKIRMNVSWDHMNGAQYEQIYQQAAGNLLSLEMQTALYANLSGNQDARLSYWLYHATARWVEEYLYGEFTLAASFADYAIAPFLGMQAGVLSGEDAVYRHGVGMAAVLKYLTSQESYGKKSIGKTFLDVAKTHNAATSLINTAGMLAVDWWPDFFKEYVSGNIYNLPLSFFRQQASGVWDVLSNSDTLKTFRSADAGVGKYADYSAKIFRVNLLHPNLHDLDSMELSVTGPMDKTALALVVYGVQNEMPFYVGTAQAQDYTIPRIKEYVDAGIKEFLIVVVNNLGWNDLIDKSDIDFSVRMHFQSPVAASTKCEVSIAVMADLVTDNNGSISHSSEMLIIGSRTATGGFNGHTFTGSYDENGFSGSISVTLNANFTQVLQVEWAGEEENEDWDIFVQKGFVAKNIPVNPATENEFTIMDGNLCDSAQSLTYYYHWGNVTTQLEDWTCQASNSSIYVGFH